MTFAGLNEDGTRTSLRIVGVSVEESRPAILRDYCGVIAKVPAVVLALQKLISICSTDDNESSSG